MLPTSVLGLSRPALPWITTSDENYSPARVKNSNDPLTRPCERFSSVHPSPPAGARELNLMSTSLAQRGEGVGVRGVVPIPSIAYSFTSPLPEGDLHGSRS